jgi:hypothetical protein
MPGRKHWGPDSMKVAVQSIPNKKMEPCSVSRIASVLRITERYLKTPRRILKF